MTHVKDILWDFFSPFSSEGLWVMGPGDSYTQIVRNWKPVQDAVKNIKYAVQNHTALFAANHMDNSQWQPGKTDQPKPGAYREFVPSPKGTEPSTCKSAIESFILSKMAQATLGGLVGYYALEGSSSTTLHTCAIGSFNIYTTVSAINPTAKTATLQYWMYNNMSKRSFGGFANDPKFSLCGMKSQYMWWHWSESVTWTHGTMQTVAPAAGTLAW